MALKTFDVWTALTPTPRDIMLALWIGVIAAVVGAVIQRVSSQAGGVDETVAHAKRDVGTELWQRIDVAASANDCDGDLLRAIVCAEVSQRPKWFRRLERVKGVFVPAGSYGPAQMTASRPVDDVASIDRLATSFAGFYPPRNSNGAIREGLLGSALDRHNRSAAFQRDVIEVFNHLQVFARWESEQRAHDGRPSLRGHDAQRQGNNWRLLGDVWAPEGALNLRIFFNSALDEAMQVNVRGTKRVAWEALVPIQAERIDVTATSAGVLVTLTVDLEDD